MPDLFNDTAWQQTHIGCWLGHALRRFDARVWQLMATALDTPLALAHLASQGHIVAAHVHLTRHLPVDGARLGALAQQAGMSKQAMAQAVEQGVVWGLVERRPDPQDGRARRIHFTAMGLDWLRAFQGAIAQAQQEFNTELGPAVATVVALGLEAYAQGPAPATPPRRATPLHPDRLLK